MIKKLIIKLKYLLAKKKYIIKHPSYFKARKIGILYNADEFDNVSIKSVQQQLSKEGKKIYILGFSNKNNILSHLFNEKDISVFGKIRNNQILNFANNNYDFLISLNTTDNLNYWYVLWFSKAQYKVGLHTRSFEKVLQMSIKPNKKKSELIDILLSYTKKIKND